MRPRRLIILSGTGTDIGKTWLGVAMVEGLIGAGWRVAVRKPAQSFEPGDASTDADRLAAASGESPQLVCPPHRWYPVAMAPPMAASVLGRPIPTLSQLSDEIGASWPDQPIDFGIVEGAGGVASPIALDGDTASLGRTLGADLAVLVADPELGTINSIRLSAGALRPIPVLVYLNRFRADHELHRRNRDWLVDCDGYSLATEVARLITSISAL